MSSSKPLKDLSDTGDQYRVSHDLYNRNSCRIERACEWVDGNLPALVASIGDEVAEDKSLYVLNVGAGDGVIDCKILHHLKKRHPRIHAVIVEPDSHMIQQYKTRVSRETTKLLGIDFEWRQETFEEYQKTSGEDVRFHYISCINSIYYLGALEKSLQYLYDKLDKGGLLLMTLLSGEGGFGHLWHYLHEKFNRTDILFTSTQIEEVCKKQDIPISEMQKIRIRCDITPCFDPPKQMSKEGKALLDFLTHMADFTQDISAKCQDDVLRFLGSEACSERGPGGDMILNGDNSAVVIIHQ